MIDGPYKLAGLVLVVVLVMVIRGADPTGAYVILALMGGLSLIAAIFRENKVDHASPKTSSERRPHAHRAA